MIPYSDFCWKQCHICGKSAGTPQRSDHQTVGLCPNTAKLLQCGSFSVQSFSEAAIPNEQDFFSREVNVLNNAHDTAIYTGSNTVIAREAIEAAGGFPTDTITEDFELGALINCQGYRSLSTLQPMASGLSPIDIPSALKQRIRWEEEWSKVSTISIFLRTRRWLWRKNGFLKQLFVLVVVLRRLLFIFAPILYTVFNVRVVETNFGSCCCFGCQAIRSCIWRCRI